MNDPKGESLFQTIKRVKTMSDEEVREAADEIERNSPARKVTITLKFEDGEPVVVTSKAIILLNETKNENGSTCMAISLAGRRANLLTLISSIPEAIDEKMGKGTWEEVEEVRRLMHLADVV